MVVYEIEALLTVLMVELCHSDGSDRRKYHLLVVRALSAISIQVSASWWENTTYNLLTTDNVH